MGAYGVVADILGVQQDHHQMVPRGERGDLAVDLVDGDCPFDGQRKRVHGDFGARLDLADPFGKGYAVQPAEQSGDAKQQGRNGPTDACHRTRRHPPRDNLPRPPRLHHTYTCTKSHSFAATRKSSANSRLRHIGCHWLMVPHKRVHTC
jgi:hypothetical protein